MSRLSRRYRRHPHKGVFTWIVERDGDFIAAEQAIMTWPERAAIFAVSRPANSIIQTESSAVSVEDGNVVAAFTGSSADRRVHSLELSRRDPVPLVDVARCGRDDLAGASSEEPRGAARVSWPGVGDVRLEAQRLAARIPEALAPLARIAYNYRWSWAPDGPALFRDLDPHRWELCAGNPVRVLAESSPGRLAKAARDPRIVERARALADLIDDDLDRPPSSPDLLEAPIAFFCAEFGVHGSLPVYSGGLGILAGDVVKEASDRALPLVAVGLLYRYGYFHQRLDLSGWQHEYWIETDPERLPAARVTTAGDEPLSVTVNIGSRSVMVQVWRVEVGRVPLYLLDTQLGENAAVDRWITSRLYIGDPSMRLAQYAVLGIGGIRVLRALGIDPSVVHLNEGHAGFATLELAAERVAMGETFEEAIATVRQRVVFTTHTPVPAGNETYDPALIMSVVPDLPARLGIDEQRFLDLGRVGSGDPRHRPFGHAHEQAGQRCVAPSRRGGASDVDAAVPRTVDR